MKKEVRENRKKVLFTATVDSHILHFHIPYLKLFKDEGYEVHVATNGDETIPYCDKKHKISFERSPFKLNNLKAIKQLKKIINSEKFEIIHCHTPMGSVVTRLAAMKARKNGTRVIYTAHGFHFYKGAPKLNWLLFYPIEKMLSRVTDTLITINEEDYNLAKKKFHTKQIELVHGVGVDPEKFNFEMSDEEKDKLRKEIGIDKDDFVMICVGELNDNKNQIMQIEAVKELVKEHKNIKLILAGDGDRREFLEQKIEEYKLQDNIKLLGYRTDIPRLLKISNLALSTSKREGLPVNVIEALTVGIPVIGTNCRGTRELVGNDFLIGQEDESVLISKIRELYTTKFSERKATDEFTLTTILEKVKNIYFHKIVIHLLASDTFSGAENVACTIIGLLEESYDMYYCSPNGNIENHLKKSKIMFIPIKKFSIREIKKVIKKIKPDIIHAHDFKASMIISSIGYNGKIISHLHKNDPKMQSRSLKSILYRICCKRINKIVGVSDSVIEEYVYANKIKDKYITLNNVVNKKEILQKADAFSINKKYDLFYIGRLSDEKNPIEFIEIIRELKQKNNDIAAIIIGDGSLKEKCYNLIADYNLEKNIDLIGFKENPFPYIANAKIGIMPSKFEGFGLTAVECMALNKPIFNSGVGGLSEIFINNKEFICKEREEYIRKIETMLNGKNTQLVIEPKYYDMDMYIEKIIKLYE